MEGNMAEIRFVNVSKVYDEDIIALERASFDIGQGEFLFFYRKKRSGEKHGFKAADRPGDGYRRRSLYERQFGERAQ